MMSWKNKPFALISQVGQRKNIPLWIPKLLTDLITNASVSGGYDSISKRNGDLACYSADYPWNVMVFHLADLK